MDGLRAQGSATKHGAHEITVIGVNPGEPPLFSEELVHWNQHRENAGYVLWIMETNADVDILLSTFRFATSIIYYPETATSLCPHHLVDLLFDCLVDRRPVIGA